MGLLTDRIRQGESGTWRKRLSDKEEDERLTPEQREEIQANRRKVVAGAALVGGIAVLLNSRDAAGSLLSGTTRILGQNSPQYLLVPAPGRDPQGAPGFALWGDTRSGLIHYQNPVTGKVQPLNPADEDLWPTWAEVIGGKPFVKVSPLGMGSPGVTEKNNGDEFGPDTEGTDTGGWAEAYAYCVTNGVNLRGIPGTHALDVTWVLGDNDGIGGFRVIDATGCTFIASPSFVGGTSVDLIQTNYAKTGSGNGIRHMVLRGFAFDNPSSTTLRNLINLTVPELSMGNRFEEWYVPPAIAGTISYSCTLDGNEDSFLLRFVGSDDLGHATAPPIHYGVPGGWAQIQGGNLPRMDLSFVTFTIKDAVMGGGNYTDAVRLVSGTGAVYQNLTIENGWVAYVNNLVDLNGIQLASLDVFGLGSFGNVNSSAISLVRDSTSAGTLVSNYLRFQSSAIGPSASFNISAASPYNARSINVTVDRIQNSNGYAVAGNMDNLGSTNGDISGFMWVATGVNNTYALVSVSSSGQPVLGTVQRTYFPKPMMVYVPVTFNPTSSAAATVTIKRGPTSTPAVTLVSDTDPATAVAGRVNTYAILLYPGDYWEVTGTNVTLGTVTYETVMP